MNQGRTHRGNFPGTARDVSNRGDVNRRDRITATTIKTESGMIQTRYRVGGAVVESAEAVAELLEGRL